MRIGLNRRSMKQLLSGARRLSHSTRHFGRCGVREKKITAEVAVVRAWTRGFEGQPTLGSYPYRAQKSEGKGE